VTSVLIVDDQELIRTGLELVLGGRGIEVRGQAGNGREAIELTRQLDPDVVLMDIRMPVLNGISATRELTTVGARARVLILTTYDADRFVYEALRVGAAGFLLKTTPPDQLVAGIETVAAGESLLAPSLTRRLIEEHVRRPPPYERVPRALQDLTQRELEVFTMISRGFANDQIAKALVVSEATVKTHVNRILAKLDLRNRVQAVVLAYESGLIRPGEREG
jgi:DNA-binding NarL/FixJ family response regulator